MLPTLFPVLSEPPSPPPSFRSIFFDTRSAVPIRVPDYQRAFAWKEEEIKLFIGDLIKYRTRPDSYYFGHFIIETVNGTWEIVDGQQRITTFVLFLMVCGHLSPSLIDPAFDLIGRFSTVSYDRQALETIAANLEACTVLFRHYRSSKEGPSDDQMTNACGLAPDTLTRSQGRILAALDQFDEAFTKGTLVTTAISEYIRVVMESQCSHHLTASKAVAVNVFEMHNTRGVRLTTVDIFKATLMKFVYDHGDDRREEYVAEIQTNFGEIYRMEELLEESSFRGKLGLEQLLRVHLRSVDDGFKRNANELNSPASTADPGELLKYLEARLSHTPKGEAACIEYALNLSREFRKSVRMASEFLPSWDEHEPLVGDVLILERDLSCQFFLLACRRVTDGSGENFIKHDSCALALWERLLFTRNFHDRYHGLTHRDNFPVLFEKILQDGAQLVPILLNYVKDGFRTWDETTNDLQGIVSEFLKTNRNQILNNAYYWGGWRGKMIYAIYKYERAHKADIRGLFKETISLEHILPQDWQWQWIEEKDLVPKKLTEEERETFLKEMNSCINGVGNLLLLPQRENASLGNIHPSDKKYNDSYAGGSYQEHLEDRKRWRDPSQWKALILERGEKRFDFIIKNLVGFPEEL